MVCPTLKLKGRSTLLCCALGFESSWLLELDVSSQFNTASGGDQAGALPEAEAGRADAACAECRMIEDIQELALQGHADGFTDGNALVHREIGVEPMQSVNVIEVGQLASGHIGSEVTGRDPSVGGEETREGLHPGTSDAGNALGGLYLLPCNAGRENNAAVRPRVQRGITAAKLHGRSALHDDDG